MPRASNGSGLRSDSSQCEFVVFASVAWLRRDARIVQARPGQAALSLVPALSMTCDAACRRLFRDFTRVNDCAKLNACSHARGSQLLANHSLHSVCALHAWALCSAGLGASLAASKSISYYHMGQYITVVSLKRAIRASHGLNTRGAALLAVRG
jgi:hypothetical protein